MSSSSPGAIAPLPLDEHYARVVQRHLEAGFPHDCSCGARFSCHGEFLERVTPIGEPVSFDELDDDEDAPAPDTQPIGMLAYAICNACGTTLAMSTLDMPDAVRRELLAWVHTEARARDITTRRLMQSVRERIQAISRAAWAARRV